MPMILIFTLLLASLGFAKDEPIKVGRFIDTYYAYDTNNPSNREREYTTQPVRHNEFNINLAHIDAVLKTDTTRGRLALQYGNSVTKNYVAELNQDMKVFQEAYVGKKIGESTWIDAGIFLGHIGYESWISKDNWTYSRSLSADFTPYYASGVRVEHAFNAKQSLQVILMNGWQTISENNSGKALGMQYKQNLTEHLLFTYNNFFGDEEVVASKIDQKFRPRFRTYHNFVLQWMKSDKWQFMSAMDFGNQSQQNSKGVDAWYAGNVTIRRVLTTERSLALRLEHFSDAHAANVSTGTPNGFQVSGASLNFDQKLDENFLWRNEIRGFYSKDEIYPAGSNQKNRLDGFFVTSLSAWI